MPRLVAANSRCQCLPLWFPPCPSSGASIHVHWPSGTILKVLDWIPPPVSSASPMVWTWGTVPEAGKTMAMEAVEADVRTTVYAEATTLSSCHPAHRLLTYQAHKALFHIYIHFLKCDVVAIGKSMLWWQSNSISIPCFPSQGAPQNQLSEIPASKSTGTPNLSSKMGSNIIQQ